jgi:hypothetical protein
LVHGPEGGSDPLNLYGGSGSPPSTSSTRTVTGLRSPVT